MINFDSRDKICKSNFGAIAAGKFMRLRLRLSPDAGAWFAYFIYKEDSEDECHEVEMSFEFSSDGVLYYKTDIRLSAGLYWYKFKYTTDCGEHFIGKGESSASVENGAFWQQTVYAEEEPKESPLEGGIIYQIFPDRFYFSGEKKQNIPSSRFLREDWGGAPEYRQEGNKCSLGNDFFSGDLKGIEEKISYIASLGVNAIYLNPIFKSSSNHRYNTGDYEQIDPLLGTEKDFVSLCKAAKKAGIRVILDGVFSHAGDDSRYFDRYGEFGTGACSSPNSPYKNWFKFEEWPHKYHSWWGIETLPEIIEENEDYINYICSPDGILRRWLRLGASGWRLDVADELPDIFLDNLHRAVKEEKADAYILGEVWEDATNKISYSERRRYLLGGQLDSVMNYPFASAIVDFIKSGNAENICETVLSICENYPPKSIATLMNHIGTHDTARILTVLGVDKIPETRAEQAQRELSTEERATARGRLYSAATLQFALPGIPSIYYGDEVGMTGFGDPFCRGCYPWGREDGEILEFYRLLGRVRRENSIFSRGEFVPYIAEGGAFAFMRKDGEERLLIAFNRGSEEKRMPLPQGFISPEIILNSPESKATLSVGELILPPEGFAYVKK